MNFRRNTQPTFVIVLLAAIVLMHVFPCQAQDAACFLPDGLDSNGGCESAAVVLPEFPSIDILAPARFTQSVHAKDVN